MEDIDSTKSIEISSAEGPDSWFDTGRISTLIYFNDDYLTGLDFESECKFLIKDYDLVLKMFNKENYFSTSKNLTDLGNKRADILY